MGQAVAAVYIHDHWEYEMFDVAYAAASLYHCLSYGPNFFSVTASDQQSFSIQKYVVYLFK